MVLPPLLLGAIPPWQDRRTEGLATGRLCRRRRPDVIRYSSPRTQGRHSSTPRRRDIPTIAFWPLPVLATRRRWRPAATSSPAAHLQAASTGTERSRGLPDFSNHPPSR